MKAHRFMIVMLIAIGMAALSCASSKELRLTTSPDIPGAQGTATISATDDANTKIDLTVEHLASPERVAPDATVYIVWVRGNEPDAQPQSLGALRVDDHLKGRISTMTPLREFELYITAEPSQASTVPTGKTLLSTTVAMK
jgi:hypothetical protein